MINLLMKTSHGDISIELNDEKSPMTVANFVNYVTSQHFDGSIFHRVIPGFMIQGGGYDLSMKEKATNNPIENEAKNGLSNDRGTLAMARTNDPHSATAQFFINLTNNDFLNNRGEQWGYAVFGKVTAGMEVVDAIAKVKTGNSGFHRDVPVTPVVIESVKVVELN
ncbi:peptidylprolyl isomerase [Silvanigrella aquatica]|uniref:Peptidyl-prolyl cis-trans isomerase n=1 Tax=Silvanigrella aquatica TaxID=1915309 RepID=A0A1L4CZ07_9BACT|nr:cyclophilin [Silvanigrella aquatica]